MIKPHCPAGVLFKNISVELGEKPVLENITAHVPPASATVIMGPNGAGKTTLLRCLLGEIKYAGQIIFSSDCSQNLKPALGYVPQKLHADSQLPLRVYEFMALSHETLPLWFGCSRKNRADAREWLKLVDAEKLENQILGNLSGGELRRVLLASALSRNPDLLLLDEAEAGVDYRGERLFWELLDKSRQKMNFTLLMVSHNLPLAAHYATHVICIKTTLLAEGPPASTLTATALLDLFGVPIHLYPAQCEDKGPACPGCGALGNRPYLDCPDQTCPQDAWVGRRL